VIVVRCVPGQSVAGRAYKFEAIAVLVRDVPTEGVAVGSAVEEEPVIGVAVRGVPGQGVAGRALEGEAIDRVADCSIPLKVLLEEFVTVKP